MDITISSIRATASNTPKVTNKICPICSKSLSKGKWSRWNDGHAEHNACMTNGRYDLWLRELAEKKSAASA